MCGRYTFITTRAKGKRVFGCSPQADLFPRYNIAPSQPVPVIRAASGTRVLQLMRWGLVPSWAKDVSIGQRMINARSETAAEKPAFRHAMMRRRCLVPADGFYEWRKLGPTTRGPRGGTRQPPKQPHYIQMADEQPFAMAGLFEHWQDGHGNELESCTILTTAANEMMATLHDRMPVILPAERYDAWLDPAADTPDDVARLAPLLAPFPAELMMHRPVSKHVNNPKHDDPRCIEPIEQQGRMF